MSINENVPAIPQSEKYLNTNNINTNNNSSSLGSYINENGLRMSMKLTSQALVIIL